MDIVLKSIPDGPVARVGQVSVPPDDFRDLYLSELTRFQALSGKKQPDDLDRINLAMKCLRLLVERSILTQEAQRRNITVSEKEVNEAWQEEIKRLGEALSKKAGESLEEAEILRLAGTTREQALAELRRTLTIEKMREQIFKDRNITVTDKEVADFFEANKANARRGDQVRLQQIFIRSQEQKPGAPKKPNASTREQALARAKNALKRIQSGESFAAVARAECDGPLKEKGGDVGLLALETLPEPLQRAIATMQPGDLSDVIESEHGFHIVKLIELVPGKEFTLEEAKPQIRAMLLSRKGNEAIRAFCEEVSQGRYPIQIYLDLEKQISVRPDLRNLFERLSDEEENDLAERSS